MARIKKDTCGSCFLHFFNPIDANTCKNKFWKELTRVKNYTCTIKIFIVWHRSIRRSAILYLHATRVYIWTRLLWKFVHICMCQQGQVWYEICTRRSVSIWTRVRWEFVPSTVWICVGLKVFLYRTLEYAHVCMIEISTACNLSRQISQKNLYRTRLSKMDTGQRNVGTSACVSTCISLRRNFQQYF